MQKFENLTLNQMAGRFAGPIPLVTKKITRRSSYTQAGSANISNSLATNPAIPFTPSAGFSRTQSLSETPVTPTTRLLRHSRSNASATVGLHGTFTDQAPPDQCNMSLSQAGLEAMDAIGENETWEGRLPTASIPSHGSPRHGYHLEIAESHEAISRRNSIRTDTTGRTERLATLIETKGPQVAIGPTIEAAGPWVRQASIIDRSHAHDILVRIRTGHPKFKDPAAGLVGLLKSKKAKQKASDDQNWVFDEGELSRALQEALESGHVGVVEVLIDKSANVNFRKEVFKHKLTGKTVKSIPFNYISMAASTGNTDMVRLLAARGASAANQMEALETAVKRNLPEIVETLLKFNVDLNYSGGTFFLPAITAQKPTIVKLLLRARKGAPKCVLTECLPTAVEQGHVEIVSLLILHGADVNHRSAEALRKAISLQRIELLLAIMKGNPSKEHVSLAFKDAFLPKSPITAEKKYLILDILLCGGACGDPVAEVLVQVVRAGHRGIARLLVAHGASLAYNGAAAMKQAVSQRDVRMLTTLSQGTVSSASASDVFAKIPQPFTASQTYSMMSILISKGARGTPLAKGLVSAVQDKVEAITILLLDHHASADYNNAQALQIATTAGDSDTVKLILSKGKPQPQSMRYVLPLVPPGPPRLRYDMTKLIIDAASTAGIPTSLLDVALMETVDTQSPQVDLDLINLVIAASADVNCLGGKSFQSAIRRGSIELLELLVRSGPQPSSLTSALPVAMRLSESGLRMKFMAILLEHGAQGSAIDQVLIEAIREKPLEANLVLKLLEKASVDHHQGQALCDAVKFASTNIVASVINFGHPNLQSRLTALRTVLEPTTADRAAKLDLLLQAGISQEGLDSALVQEISNELRSDIIIINVLLDHGASCSYDGGKSLERATISKNTQVLKCLVSRKNHSRVLAKMLPLTRFKKDPSTRYVCMNLLLSGGAKGDEISHELVYEICSSHECDPQLIKLMIDQGARVDNSEGRAIKHAVSTRMKKEILELLLEGKGATTMLSTLVPLAMNHTQETRPQVLQMLLEKGARGTQIHDALIDAVKEGPSAQTTIDLLLHYDASVNYRGAEAIKVAAAAGHSSILDCLLQRHPDPEYLPEALKLAMQAPVVQSGTKDPIRFKSVRLLTRAGINKSEAISRALTQAVREKDHSLVAHLIESGGDPNFWGGKCLIVATEQADLESLILLARIKPSSTAFSAAFASRPTSIDRWRGEPELLLRIDSILIDGGARGPAVDQTFQNALRSSDPAGNKFVGMVFARPAC